MCKNNDVTSVKDIILFEGLLKKKVKKDIADTLYAIDTKISTLAKEAEIPEKFLYKHLYCFDEKGSDYKKFVDFLCKDMRYARNDFSVREIFEIGISFYRPTLQYKWELEEKFGAQNIPLYGAEFSYQRISRTKEQVIAKISPFPKKAPYMWEKVNYAQVLLENCDRKDFLKLLTSYNRHRRIFLTPQGEPYVDILDSNIKKDSSLYTLCTDYFSTDIGFESGLSISMLDFEYLKSNDMPLIGGSSIDREIDARIAKTF